MPTLETYSPRTILHGPKMVPDSRWIKKSLFYSENFSSLTPRFITDSSLENSQTEKDLELCSERGIWSPVDIYSAVPNEKLLQLSSECIDYARSEKVQKNLGRISKQDRVFAEKFPHELEYALLESGHLREGSFGDGQEGYESEYKGLVPTLLTVFTREVALARGWIWDVTDKVHVAQAIESGMFPEDLPSHQGVVTTIKRTLVPRESVTVLEILDFRDKNLRKFDNYMKALRRAEMVDQIQEKSDREETGKLLNARIKELELLALRVDMPLGYKVQNFLQPLVRGSILLTGLGSVIAGQLDSLTPDLNLHTATYAAAVGIVVVACEMRQTATSAAYLSLAAKNSMFQ